MIGIMIILIFFGSMPLGLCQMIQYYKNLKG
ncbi:hypothetical protein FF306_01077 [Apilactobacillus kunkeei]|uniref:Uncharacterized protein n=1 Tax=Apilactobacillus kunkeei TaxID=148814 RepID=A0A1L8CID8_9LACO|nr:hypothetical protein FF306_01077 [Apilactobacillus kunkeei]